MILKPRGYHIDVAYNISLDIITTFLGYYVIVSVPQLVQQAIESESKLGLAIKPYVEQDISGK